MSSSPREDLDASLRATAGVVSVLRTLELGLELGKPSHQARVGSQIQYNYRRTHIHTLDAIATVLATENARIAVTFAGPFLQDDTLTVELAACSAPNVSHQNKAESIDGCAEVSLESSRCSIETMAGDSLDVVWRTGRSLPLQHHIHTLNESVDSFLSSPDEKARMKVWKRVMKYVIASSCRKMHRRVTSSFSLTFLNNILALPKPSSISAPFRQPRCPDGFQKARDLLFLARFHDPVFVRKLGSLQFPNLTKLGHAVFSKPSALFTLYNQRTCDEIHGLLCFLIGPDGFVGRLDRLVALMEDHSQAIRDSPSESVTASPELSKACSSVTTLGMVLRDLIYSSAFEEHTTRMLPHLQISLPGLKDSKSAEGKEGNILDEDEAEAELLNIYFNLDVQQIYIKWAQLQVSFFEALYTIRAALGDILNSAVKGGRKCKVSIKTLITPPWQCGSEGGELRIDTWRRVFQDCLPSVATDYSGDFSSSNAIKLFEHLLEEGALLDELGDNSPLSKGVATFYGRVHSEACLASLMHRPDSNGWDQLFHCTSSAIGLSQSCCNICSAFLSTLNGHEGRKIKVRPPQKVSGPPCNLPPWVPDHLVTETLLHLRREVFCSLQAFFTHHISSPYASDTSGAGLSDDDSSPEFDSDDS